MENSRNSYFKSAWIDPGVWNVDLRQVCCSQNITLISTVSCQHVPTLVVANKSKQSMENDWKLLLVNVKLNRRIFSLDG